jgi:MoaA/NifB/PqqE/SkfB family radical SAM enzyme
MILKNFTKQFKVSFTRYLNYFLKREFIPDMLNNINIETTSICNLSCKFCAYDKRDLQLYPHATMSNENFKFISLSAQNFGYKNIGLTPTTGDIFMDKRIIEKFKILENLKINSYYFYTNFIPVSKSQIDELVNLKKLTNFGISIYGHDLDTFKNFSNGNEVSFGRLIDNLKYLYSILNNKINNTIKIEISHRTEKNYNLHKSNDDLAMILKKLITLNNSNYIHDANFNNWGGLINKEHIKNLNINFDYIFKKKLGPCAIIFSRLIIGADGTVNACACRDANFTLKIGNIFEKPLKEIITMKNEKYKNIILNQEKNNFEKVCNSCDFYKSIYDEGYKIWSFKNNKQEYISLNKAKKILNS